jgi:hypothetical protein
LASRLLFTIFLLLFDYSSFTLPMGQLQYK